MTDDGPERPVAPASRSPLATQADGRDERADWRSSVIGTIWITALIGGWLALSPLALDYEQPAGAIVLGALVVVLCALRLTGPRSATLALTTLAAGALIAAAALVLPDAPAATANLLLMGAAVVILTLIGINAGAEARRRSRG